MTTLGLTGAMPNARAQRLIFPYAAITPAVILVALVSFAPLAYALVQSLV